MKHRMVKKEVEPFRFITIVKRRFSMRELGGIEKTPITQLFQWIVRTLYPNVYGQEGPRCQAHRIEEKVGGLQMVGEGGAVMDITPMKHGVIAGPSPTVFVCI